MSFLEERKIKKFEDFPISKPEDFEEIKEINPEDIKEEQKIKDFPTSKSKDFEEKKISDWILIISVVIVLLILAFIISLKFLQKEQPKTIDDLHQLNLEGKLKPEQGYVYNGYSFVFANGLWYTQVQNRDGTNLFNIPLHYAPQDLVSISVEGALNATLFNSSGIIYITFDPLGTNLQYVALAIGEFDQSITTAFNKLPIAACDRNETKACETRPIITCNSTKMPVLHAQQKPEPKVIFDDNCIIVQGEMQDMVRAMDRLLLKLYSIMP